MELSVELKKLVDELEGLGVNDIEEDVLDHMYILCQNYKVDAISCASKWVSFSLNKNSCKLNIDNLITFEKELLLKPQKKEIQLITPTRKPKKRNHQDMIIDDYHPDSPRSNSNLLDISSEGKILSFSPTNMSSSPRGGTPSAKYQSRTNSGGVMVNFGPKEADWVSKGSACTVDWITPWTTDKKGYMFEKLRDRATVLTDLMVQYTRFLEDANDIKEWGSINRVETEEFHFSGHIMSLSQEKLSSSNIFLENSLGDWPVQLDVSFLKTYSFFPGQIIGAKGTNANGNAITVTEILPAFTLPPDEFTLDFPDKEPLHIIAAAGPYTTLESLEYEPLTDLMKYCQKHKPHVLILMGPFVDVKHSFIETGQFNDDFEDVFNELVSKISLALEGIKTQVVLVPSLRDAGHDIVYPIPPFSSLKRTYKNVKLMSDPCYLNVHGICIGVTSTDILFHLGKEEINFPPNSSDRLGRLCQHLLEQHSLYPLYPPSEDVPVDYELFNLNGLMISKPHILLLPSDLRGFVKNVNGCCCINPERLTRGQSGGHFVRLQISSDPEGRTDTVIPHLQAQIVKI